MNNLQIYNKDCREAPQYIADASVDLIFTDPPYPKQYHYCYEWLAQEAARVLKPTGFLIAYTGPYWKDVVMGYFGQHLDYFYDFVLIHGDTSILWPRKVVSGYKSLLCYHRKTDRPLPRMNVLGKFDASAVDKRFHTWGQSEKEARYYIDVFTKPDDLVVDYFSGGGTTAAVCKRLRRRFIGFEIDTLTYDLACARLDGALGPAEQGRQHSLEIPEDRDNNRQLTLG